MLEKDYLAEAARKASLEQRQRLKFKERELKEISAQISSVDQEVQKVQRRLLIFCLLEGVSVRVVGKKP